MKQKLKAASIGLLTCGIFYTGGLLGFSEPSPQPNPPITQRIILPQWEFQPGPGNSITDVPGVQVGHVTIQKDAPHRIRTGVTAIVPHAQNLATVGLWASGLWLNGNGELTGIGPLQSSGILSSPILLTNTFAVGAVHTGVFRYFLKHYPGDAPGSTVWAGQLPVVGECYDGYFNTIEDLNAVTPEDAVKAIESAKTGPVEQGRIGAGTGMRSFELHAGIGSASRRLMMGGHSYTLGVLVNMNHSHLKHLNPDIRARLEKALGASLEALHQQDEQDSRFQQTTAIRQQPTRQGSIMVVIATDLPLGPQELHAIAERSVLGIGATGSTMNTTSGDGVIAFSTAETIPLTEGKTPPGLLKQQTLHPDHLSPVYRATVEAVTEAQINALLASHQAHRPLASNPKSTSTGK